MSYSSEDDPHFGPDSMAEDFSDEIREYITIEAKTPEQAKALVEKLLKIISDSLRTTDWKEAIESNAQLGDRFLKAFDDDREQRRKQNPP